MEFYNEKEIEKLEKLKEKLEIEGKDTSIIDEKIKELEWDIGQCKADIFVHDYKLVSGEWRPR